MILYIIAWRVHCTLIITIMPCMFAVHWSTRAKNRLYARCILVFRRRSCIENRPEEGWAEKLGCRARWQMQKSPASWAPNFGSLNLIALLLQSYKTEATCRSSWKCELMLASWRPMRSTWTHGEIAGRPPSPHTNWSRSNEASLQWLIEKDQLKPGVFLAAWSSCTSMHF